MKEELESDKELDIDWRHLMYQYKTLPKEEYTDKHIELLKKFNDMFDRFKKEFEEFKRNELNDFLKENDQRFEIESNWGVHLTFGVLVGVFQKFDEEYEGYRNYFYN